MRQQLKNNTPNCDVFSSTDIAHYPALIKHQALMKYDTADASDLAGPYKGLGEPGYYYPTTGSVQILVYNTKNLTGA